MTSDESVYHSANILAFTSLEICPTYLKDVVLSIKKIIIIISVIGSPLLDVGLSHRPSVASVGSGFRLCWWRFYASSRLSIRKGDET